MAGIIVGLDGQAYELRVDNIKFLAVDDDGDLFAFGGAVSAVGEREFNGARILAPNAGKTYHLASIKSNAFRKRSKLAVVKVSNPIKLADYTKVLFAGVSGLPKAMLFNPKLVGPAIQNSQPQTSKIRYHKSYVVETTFEPKYITVGESGQITLHQTEPTNYRPDVGWVSENSKDVMSNSEIPESYPEFIARKLAFVFEQDMDLTKAVAAIKDQEIKKARAKALTAARQKIKKARAKK